VESRTTAYVLTRVWSDGYNTCDFALVPITPEFVAKASNLVGIARQVVEQVRSFDHFAVWDQYPVLFRWFPEGYGGGGPGVERVLAQVERDEGIVLRSAFPVPEVTRVPSDVVTLEVRTDSIRWRGYVARTDVRWETAEIPIEVLAWVSDSRGGFAPAAA
jgi:hypothetical protein